MEIVHHEQSAPEDRAGRDGLRDRAIARPRGVSEACYDTRLAVRTPHPETRAQRSPHPEAQHHDELAASNRGKFPNESSFSNRADLPNELIALNRGALLDNLTSLSAGNRRPSRKVSKRPRTSRRTEAAT